MIQSAFCSFFPALCSGCSSEYLKREMNLLLVECGIEKYKTLFYGISVFAFNCNRENRSHGQLNLTPAFQERIHALAPPEEDRRKIDDFLNRMASVLCQCFKNS